MSASFTFPDVTMKVIEDLKSTFKVGTDAEVLSRALALAQVIAGEADESHTVLLAGKDNKTIRLSLDR